MFANFLSVISAEYGSRSRLVARELCRLELLLQQLLQNPAALGHHCRLLKTGTSSLSLSTEQLLTSPLQERPLSELVAKTLLGRNKPAANATSGKAVRSAVPSQPATHFHANSQAVPSCSCTSSAGNSWYSGFVHDGHHLHQMASGFHGGFAARAGFCSVAQSEFRSGQPMNFLESMQEIVVQEPKPSSEPKKGMKSILYFFELDRPYMGRLEKLYWVSLLSVLVYLLFDRIKGRPTPQQIAERERKAAELEVRRQEKLRAVMAGKSFLEDDDLFDGLSPTQIEEYIKKSRETLGMDVDDDDPYEGLSPEEIDEYVRKYGIKT